MNTFIKLSAVSLAALVAVGCTSQKKIDQDIKANEEATAKAQERADAAYAKADEALGAAITAAETAQLAADEANAAAMRMLEKHSQK